MTIEAGGIGEVRIHMGHDLIEVFRDGGRTLQKLVRPYPKSFQARKEVGNRKSSVPDELKPAYQSVQAGLLAVLGMSSSEEAGLQGLEDRGGSDSPFHNLQLLRERLTNRQIAEEFLNSDAMKEYRKDPFARDKVITALGSLQNAFPINALP